MRKENIESTSVFHEETMEKVINQAKEESEESKGKKTFEKVLADILHSDGLDNSDTIINSEEFQSALKEKNLQKLSSIAHTNGWL